MTRRSRHSRQNIVDAVCEATTRLHGGRPTVAAVCEIAGVSRRTFYRHFESIRDALDRGVEESWTLLRDDLLTLRPEDDLVLTAASLAAILRYAMERSSCFRYLLDEGAASARLFTLALELSRVKSVKIGGISEAATYQCAGVLAGTLRYAVEHPVAGQGELGRLVRETIGFLRGGLHLGLRSINMHQAGRLEESLPQRGLQSPPA